MQIYRPFSFMSFRVFDEVVEFNQLREIVFNWTSSSFHDSFHRITRNITADKFYFTTVIDNKCFINESVDVETASEIFSYLTGS